MPRPDNGKKTKNNSASIFGRGKICTYTKLLSPFWQNRRTALGLCLGALAVIILTFLLAPTIPLPGKALQIGDIASKDIKASHDYLLEDISSTQKKRRQAEAGVRSVYDYDPKVAEEALARLTKAFEIVGNALSIRAPEMAIVDTSELGKRESMQREWDKQLYGSLKPSELPIDKEKILNSPFFNLKEKEFQKIIGFQMPGEVKKVLRNYQYKAEIKAHIAKMLGQLYHYGVVNDKKMLLADKEKGISLRELEKGAGKIISDVTQIMDREEASEFLLRAAASLAPEEDAAFHWSIAKIASALVQPNLTFNKQETEKQKKEAVAAVKPVYSQIKKGEMIVREGERVSEEAFAKLQAIMALESKKGVALSIVGLLIIVGLFMVSLLAYLRKFKPKFFAEGCSLLLLGLLLVSNVAVAKLATLVFNSLSESVGYIGPSSYYYAIPFTAGPMLVAIVFGAELGLIFSLFNSFLVAVLMRDGFAYSLVAMVASLAAINRAHQCQKRSSIVKAGLYISLANIVAIGAINLMNSAFFSLNSLLDILMGLVGGALVAAIVSVAMPLVESLFNVTTDIELLELSNLNHPLLRQMVLQTPGTYHHSMIVGNLAEEAAEATGANSLLARVACYYHDLGKLRKPEYYIENQKDGRNKHDSLAPRMSSLIIKSHVKDGIEIAREYKLPEKIVEIITQHHGTSLISYFYNKAKEKEDPSIEVVSENDYRYTGPKPQTKEAAIVMLADKLEAASRALTDPTPARIKGLVKKIINADSIDGQLDNCDLTLRDLNDIADSFARILTAIFHQRIGYPAPRSEWEEKGKKEINGSVIKKLLQKGKPKFQVVEKHGPKNIEKIGPR